MSAKEILSTASKALMLNKVRSFLTMLGVIIGVFAVISLVSLVGGVQDYVVSRFEDLGSNLVFVVNGKIELGQRQSTTAGSALISSNLKEKHIEMIKSSADDYVDYVTPETQTYQTVKYKTEEYFLLLIGVNYEANDIFKSNVEKGRYFNRVEQENSSRVVVLGNNLAKKFFGEENPIGKKIKINGKSYEVVGLLAKKSPNYDESVILPYTTIMDDFTGTEITSIVIKVKDNVDLEQAQQQIKLSLLKDLKEDQFTVMTQEDILDSIQSILNMLTIALASISGISLLVGGIGIMNIMLVSVAERTKEIGLRKALGATSSDIRNQFMAEAILISSLGGLVGLLLGWVATILIKPLIQAVIPVWAIPLALGFSIAVGIIFGTYPAVNASKKDPIEALRYE
ncbi:MAG TPA: ABC transporter permease [bacterium]|jgi:putative ABC transport system permease protein|nr:ABC transporter permease [bacterium]